MSKEKVYDLESFVNAFEEDFKEDFGDLTNWRRIGFFVAGWLEEKKIAEIRMPQSNYKTIFSRQTNRVSNA